MFIEIKIKRDFLLIFLFLPIFIISKLLPSNYKRTYEKNFFEIVFPLSRTCLFFFYLYEKISLKTKDVNPSDINIITFQSNINKVKYKNRLKFKIFYYLFLSHINYVIYLYLNELNLIFYFSGYSELLLIFLIDGYCFRNAIYSHHLLSIILNFILFISMVIYSINSFKQIIISLPILILNGYCYGFSILLIKYINYKYYINIYLMASVTGLTHIIYDIFLILFQFKKFTFLNLNFIIYVLYFFISLLYNYLYYNIINKSGVIYALMFYYISYLFYKIMNDKDLFTIMAMVVFIISSLIYIELLILKFCGLNKNVGLEIEDRSEKERKEIFNDLKNQSSFLEE